jgi:DNA-directed RNA polymerase subunit beta
VLRAIFGENASDVRDNSLRLLMEKKALLFVLKDYLYKMVTSLSPGVLEQVKVWVADTKKLGYGDKKYGRHGDKNTVSAIRPLEVCRLRKMASLLI